LFQEDPPTEVEKKHGGYWPNTIRMLKTGPNTQKLLDAIY